MKYLKLFAHMTRYRSALVLIIFMMLSIAIHNIDKLYTWPAFVAAVTLVLIYTAATCANDLADWKIDRINLQGHSDRPLITGQGSRSELIVIAIVSGTLALALASLLGSTAVLITIIGIVLNTLYSLPPTRIAYRPILTPFYLAFCYVLIAYTIGYVVASKNGTTGFDCYYALALYFLFLARISLKDFRDRKGDALNNKATLLLSYGKTTVCLLSSVSLVIGTSLLITHTPDLTFKLFIALFLPGLALVEIKLYQAHSLDMELLSIGYGARLGNGILFALLGSLILNSQHATSDVQLVFYASLLVIYGTLFGEYLRRPDTFYFGKRKIRTS